MEIAYCIFNNSFTTIDEGGACYINADDVNLNNNQFIDCVAESRGGAIKYYISKSVILAGNNFIRCILMDLEINPDPDGHTSDIREGGAISIESSTNTTLTNNTIIDCNATYHGGAIESLGLTSEINLLGNIFENCYSSSFGGAIYFLNVKIAVSSNNTFTNCYSNGNHGGVFYFSHITNPVNMKEDKFYSCYSGGYGGSICFASSKTLAIRLNNITMTNCTSENRGSIFIDTIYSVLIDGLNCIKSSTKNWGGAIYLNNIPNDVYLLNSNFEDCSVQDDGGVIYVYYGKSFKVDNCKFIRCSANKGGGVHLSYSDTYVTIINSNFISCTAKEYGSGIYYYYTYTIKDDISYTSKNNTFENCKSGLSGSLYIDSKRIDNSTFFYDKFINCTSKADGGGFMCKIYLLADLEFAKCIFTECKSNKRAGGIGFDLFGDDSLAIRVKGCEFEKCSSTDGACIGVFYSGGSTPKYVTLNINSFGGDPTTFKHLNGASDKYSIFAYAHRVDVINAEFENIDIGVLNTTKLCFNLKVDKCSFISCDSKNYIISSPALTNFVLSNLVFNNCGGCYLVKSTNIDISFVSMNDTKEHTESPSIITGDIISIKDIKLNKHNDIFTINAIKEMNFIGGSFTKSTKSITIDSSNKSSIVFVESLTTYDALMFSITNNINGFTLVNSNGSYLHGISPFTLLSSNAKFTNITNCNFDTGSSIPIVLQYMVGAESLIDSCNIKGDGTNIKVDSDLILKNSTLKSKNGYAIDMQQSGKLYIADTNCIFSLPNMDIKGSSGKLFDLNKNSIISYHNNEEKCAIETPSYPISHETSNPTDFATFIYTNTEINIDNIISSTKTSPEPSVYFNEVLTSFYKNKEIEYDSSLEQENFDINHLSSHDEMPVQKENTVSHIAPPLIITTETNIEPNMYEQSHSITFVHDKHLISYKLDKEETRNHHLNSKSENNIENIEPTSIPKIDNTQTEYEIHSPTNIKETRAKTTQTFSQTIQSLSESLIHTSVLMTVKTDTYIKTMEHKISLDNNKYTKTSSSIVSVKMTKLVKSESYSRKNVIESKLSLHVDSDVRLSLDNLQDEDQSSGQNKSNVGMIAGIAVAIVVVVVIIVLIVICAVVKKGRKDTDDIRETEFETDFSTTTSSSTYGTTACMTQEMPTTSWTANNPAAEEDFYRMDFEEDDKD